MTTQLLRTALAGAAILSFTIGSQAATVFSDNFDTDPVGLNAVPTGWTVTDGTVDIIGTPGFYDLLPGNGRYVDLDGTSKNAGILGQSIALTGGTQYLLSFSLAGSQRGDSNTVDVAFGSSLGQYTLTSGAGFSTFSLLLTPVTTGSYAFSFANQGGDNIGVLLDNVSVSAVPEPETYALLLAGLGVIGFLGKRRKVG